MEIDEFYVNAGDKGIKKENSRKRGLKRKGRGTYKSERPPIITLYNRTDKRVLTSVETNLSKTKIWKMISEVNSDDLIVNTDEYTIYENLESHPKVFKHLTVNHASKEYSNGISHVNNCECFHSIIKPHLRKHRGISRRNLHLYVSFHTFIYNYKSNWFSKLLSLILCNDT
ncbi:IS1595 family transposase [Methanotorris igneus]|uniref:IS1595 family transposase n=1 Tax=Methanotorris igneus TaxID=2189 RepID=UPI00064E2E95|nr:IS1595 family transposase [Methanotorris igneus]